MLWNPYIYVLIETNQIVKTTTMFHVDMWHIDHRRKTLPYPDNSLKWRFTETVAIDIYCDWIVPAIKQSDMNNARAMKSKGRDTRNYTVTEIRCLSTRVASFPIAPKSQIILKRHGNCNAHD